MSLLCEGRAITLAQPFDTGGRSTLRLLMTSAGRRVGLMQCFQHEAQALGIPLEILACDMDPRLSPACRLADGMFAVPPASDPGYVDELVTICTAYQVAIVIPTIDPELLPLSLARQRFAAIGTNVVISSPALVEMARDKFETAKFLTAHGIPNPRTALIESARASPGDWDWPVMVKPRHGSASRGIRTIHAPADLPTDSDEPLVVQELLSGPEYTVNMFFDAAGSMHAAVPHQRLRVRAGEVEKGTTRRDPALAAIAAEMARALPGPRGALCFQAIMNAEGRPSVFEINARFGGGYPLAHNAGARFARWILEAQTGLPSTAADSVWREDLTMLRYDAAVFVSP